MKRAVLLCPEPQPESAKWLCSSAQSCGLRAEKGSVALLRAGPGCSALSLSSRRFGCGEPCSSELQTVLFITINRECSPLSACSSPSSACSCRVARSSAAGQATLGSRGSREGKELSSCAGSPTQHGRQCQLSSRAGNTRQQGQQGGGQRS
eukprot:364922-Chlamydomonas_euryale.AAC.10